MSHLTFNNKLITFNNKYVTKIDPSTAYDYYFDFTLVENYDITNIPNGWVVEENAGTIIKSDGIFLYNKK